MKTDDFRTIFRSSFGDTEEWQQWFFGHVATNAEQIFTCSDAGGKAASALLMQPYAFQYRGRRLSSGYISCVSTLPECRSQGLASRVLGEALTSARQRGMALCSLIPAETHLFDFYARRGFSPVYYVDEERYTSLHSFRGGCGEPVEPSFDIFHGLEERLGCGVLHTRQDYDNILADMAIDGRDTVLAMRQDEGYAMLFANLTAKSDVRVKCLMADSEELATGALARLRELCGERDITVRRIPLGGEKELRAPYGMLRIVNPLLLLGTLAESDRSLKFTLALTDTEMPANSSVYCVASGHCRRLPSVPGADTLQLDAATLAAVLFGSHEIGTIMGIPSRRPYMALMLD